MSKLSLVNATLVNNNNMIQHQMKCNFYAMFSQLNATYIYIAYSRIAGNAVSSVSKILCLELFTNARCTFK